MKKDVTPLYKLLFSEYPDIVTVRQMQDMLNISRHVAYDLIHSGAVRCIKLGNAYKIPKINVILYVLQSGMVESMMTAGIAAAG